MTKRKKTLDELLAEEAAEAQTRRAEQEKEDAETESLEAAITSYGTARGIVKWLNAGKTWT
jgi:hypothetical protein